MGARMTGVASTGTQEGAPVIQAIVPLLPPPPILAPGLEN
jgi:hypothetical protein